MAKTQKIKRAVKEIRDRKKKQMYVWQQKKKPPPPETLQHWARLLGLEAAGPQTGNFETRAMTRWGGVEGQELRS